METLKDNDQLSNNGHEGDTPKEFTPIQEKFLVAFLKVGQNISQAAEAVGISRRQVYNWIKNNSEFKDKIEELKEEDNDHAEDELKYHRDGQYKWMMEKDENGKDTDKYVLDHKKEKVREYIVPPNMAALIFFLRRRHPDYKDKKDQTIVTTTGLGGITIDIAAPKYDSDSDE